MMQNLSGSKPFKYDYLKHLKPTGSGSGATIQGLSDVFETGNMSLSKANSFVGQMLNGVGNSAGLSSLAANLLQSTNSIGPTFPRNSSTNGYP
jgi:hypothetical protein